MSGDMPDELDDLNDSASEDIRKAYQSYENYKQGDNSLEAAIPSLIEGILWTLSLVALVGFGVGMFFVNESAISGAQWLVWGCGGILVFGGLAMLFRVFRP